MHKLIRITTIPLSLEKLLEGQLTYMNEFYEVIAVSAEKERLKKFGRENNVRTYHVDMTRAITPMKDLKAVYKLYRFLKKEKPLIVHTHTPKAGIVGMMAAKMAGVPVRLHTVAGLPLLEARGAKRKILNNVEKLTYKLATKVYPNSNGLRDIIIENQFAEEDKLKILGEGSSNGIDTSYFDGEKYPKSFKEKQKAELNIPLEDVVFIFIGRLVSEKGINELVGAFKQLQETTPSITLLLVGPFEEELDPLHPETIKEIENNSKIISTGYQVDVRPYLMISDVLAFPSYREGFPNVVLQAGAMGLPSIVSDINGCNEIIEADKNGIIIPVKNKDALHKAMDTLAKTPALRNKMASGSREMVRTKYERRQFWKILKKEYELLESRILTEKEN